MRQDNDGRASGRKRRYQKSKSRGLPGAVKAAIILCGCFVVILLAFYLFTAGLPFSENRASESGAESTAVSHPDNGALGGTQNDDNAWNLILVNKWNPLPESYLVEWTELANGEKVDKRIYPALQEMFDAARNNGFYPVVASGYRTAEEQQGLMDAKIAEFKAEGYSDTEAAGLAEEWVAVPGTSEHQLGIAVDINADGVNSAGYEVYEWLDQNAYQYGFILRFPPDKTEITGVSNEPWHYRYVGVEAATEIYNQGVCLEEYLGRTN